VGVLELKNESAIVTVFGSAVAIPGDDAYERARELGQGLASAGFRLCNGGYGGTMEAAARGAREARGTDTSAETIGVICDIFGDRSANSWIDEIRHSTTLFERLEQLIALGDAYVVLPGGTGTLLELAAVLELTTKGLIPPRPVILLGGYWEDVLTLAGGPPAGSNAKRIPLRTVKDVPQCIAALISTLGGKAHGS
jgi:uncharacterized protein (TIGR00730 family)